MIFSIICIKYTEFEYNLSLFLICNSHLLLPSGPVLLICNDKDLLALRSSKQCLRASLVLAFAKHSKMEGVALECEQSFC